MEGLLYNIKQTHLDEGISLHAFGVLHSHLQPVGCSAEDGIVFERDRLQYVGQVASIIQTGHKHVLLIVGLRLGRQRHRGSEKKSGGENIHKSHVSLLTTLAGSCHVVCCWPVFKLGYMLTNRM